MDSDQNKNLSSKQNPGTMQTVGAFIWDLVKILIIALVIIVPFRTFVAEPFVVSGSSMLPNFVNHDYLIVDRLSYISGQPKRGDVIVLKFPKDTTQFFIKRIIGLPGETVQLTQGHVMIINDANPNGIILSEPYLPDGTQTLGRTDPVHLGTDEFFVLGDNRTASSDSRVWGILPRNDIVGRVWARVYPFSTAGFMQTPSY
jgi:signal peptidase I